ncbi:MAG TPA: hypothetical protein VGZ93_13340 [Candidatus Methylacidiphilales bacterium]|jgi:preprotein translocase subunit SecD|nr:hypothetical protein [Candidatus Methylacidiphilales bacterium]
MRPTCLLIALLFLAFLPARAGHSPPKILLRVHVQTTDPGQSAQEATTITIPPNGEQIQVRTLPELTEQEIIGVQQDASGSVRLQFNHTGQVDLSAVTAQNQGRILVVLIDGYVIYAPVIDEQITNGELDIPRRFGPQLVQLLQEVARENLKQAART